MSRKIRITGAIVILIVFLSGLINVCNMSAKSVGSVKRVTVEQVGASDMFLSWRRVGGADGYNIYLKKDADESFVKAAELKQGTDVGYGIEKLDPSCKYQVYVTAVKNFKDEIVESKDYSAVSFKTLPGKMAVKLASDEKGVLKISWKLCDGVEGYEIQYSQDKSFKKAELSDINDSGKKRLKIKDLEQDKDYYVRARCYDKREDEKIYGEWSKVESVTIMSVIDLTHLDPTKPMVALTFDDGPGYNKSSDKILDVLEKYEVRATFFMVGQNAADHPANVKRKLELGCELGNHTYDHNHYGKNVGTNDIRKCSDAIFKACGQYPTCFRSPGGNTTETIRNECKNEKMPLYYWSLDTQDWKSRNADSVYNAVINNVKDGDIILMHEIYDSTAEATARIVPELIKRGYQLVTCQELVTAKGGNPPVAGEQYLNATTVKNQTS